MASLLRRVRPRTPPEPATAKPTSSGPAPAPATAGADSPAKSTRPRPTLAALPPEIHLLIAEHLSYPDALSLKHTNRHFYRLVDTGVALKVEWLMERRLLHLECPSDSRCDLGSDLRFCRGSVKLLMQRRREHIECESRPGLGCIVYGTRTCPHARKLKTRVKKWMRARGLPLHGLAGRRHETGAGRGAGGGLLNPMMMRCVVPLLLVAFVPLVLAWVVGLIGVWENGWADSMPFSFERLIQRYFQAGVYDLLLL